ncbi:MAG: DNA polymerase/3'-5' exonuclease PolX [Patescibacteria group bacterium]|nr:DNA polymerase/3'-5' exonuclease PolX [Patescibacteria group bacterium]MBU1877294.1 DNA polymerase/3'-5' exonuclease PolX [Patescibacteria group bacterium]
MLNQELAKIFYEIADFLEMDDIPFKPNAYRKVAFVLENFQEDIEDVYLRKGVESLNSDIPGVGESIAKKIEEYIKTGKIRYFEQLKKKTPIDMEKLNAIEGLGPKKIKTLYQKLGIKNVNDLEREIKAGRVSSLFGFGQKTEANLLEGILFLQKTGGRFLLGDILPKVKEIIKQLKKLQEIEKIDVAGSIRRGKETVRDVDLLVIAKKPDKVMDFFVSMPGVIKVWSKGKTKSSIRIKDGFDVDLRVVAKKSYGSALQYFTGSKEHNIATRRIAISCGLKLNEYGVFKQGKAIAGSDETSVYRALQMPYIEPELRENRGEIKAALKDKLPKIINQQDIKGDIHCHSDWNGGQSTIIELAQSAIKMGYQYLGITDHTYFLRIEKGLDEKKLIAQMEEIDKLNRVFQSKNTNFRILKGAETNILDDGSIDISDEVLAKLDYAVAGVHSNHKMEKEDMTERILKAMQNPYIKIISHPTGRILQERDEYKIDLDKILKAAKDYNVALEINSSPRRLDLNDENIKKAKSVGVKMVISSDAHHKTMLNYINFGIIQARRGWAEKSDILNTLPVKDLLKFFKNI